MVLQKAKNKRKSKQSESFRCGFKGVASWCLFDWAHQPFPTVITTFIFSTFFIKSVAPNEIKGTEYWSWAVAVSGIFVAILAPILEMERRILKAPKRFLPYRIEALRI